MMFSESTLSKLPNLNEDKGWTLPAIDKQSVLRSSVNFYGAIDAWRTHCGIQNLPVSDLFRSQHGWCVQERQLIDPILLIQEPEIHLEKTYLVARGDEQDFLRERGINAKAIGLPYVYAKPMAVQRRPGSLLVMPAHSLEYTRHQWKFDEYADRIRSIAKQFSEVVCCVHPACEINGYWKTNFERLGIQCITGAETADRNGLVRIKTLMNQFEFMTTNVLGSHVVYAAAEGVKVSIFGDYAEYRSEDYAETEFYQRHAHVLSPVLDLFSRNYVRKRYPNLFCNPMDAKKTVTWAANEIGEQNRLSPKQLAALFGWNRLSQIKKNLRTASRKLIKSSERFLKSFMTGK